MRKLQTQGVHHITLVGADRETSIGFWDGVLGMPFVFEQPNLDNEAESHLYFDPGDGRLITVFTNEEREADGSSPPREPGNVHHLAFALSQATFAQAVQRLDRIGEVLAADRVVVALDADPVRLEQHLCVREAGRRLEAIRRELDEEP